MMVKDSKPMVAIPKSKLLCPRQSTVKHQRAQGRCQPVLRPSNYPKLYKNLHLYTWSGWSQGREQTSTCHEQLAVRWQLVSAQHGTAATFLSLRQSGGSRQNGLFCFAGGAPAAAAASLSELSMSHMTWTSLYPQVCTSWCRFSAPLSASIIHHVNQIDEEM